MILAGLGVLLLIRFSRVFCPPPSLTSLTRARRARCLSCMYIIVNVNAAALRRAELWARRRRDRRLQLAVPVRGRMNAGCARLAPELGLGFGDTGVIVALFCFEWRRICCYCCRCFPHFDIPCAFTSYILQFSCWQRRCLSCFDVRSRLGRPIGLVKVLHAPRKPLGPLLQDSVGIFLHCRHGSSSRPGAQAE